MKKRLIIGIGASSMLPLQVIGAPLFEDAAGSQAVSPPASTATTGYESGPGAPESWGPSAGAYSDDRGHGASPGPQYDRPPQPSYGGYRYGYGHSQRSNEPPRGYQYGYGYGSDVPPYGYEHTYGPETPPQGYGAYGPPSGSYGYGPPAGYGAPPAYREGWGGYPPYGPDPGYGEMPQAPDAGDYRAGVPRGAPPGYGVPQPYRDAWQGAPGYDPGTPDKGGVFGGYPGGYAPSPYPRGPAMPGGERDVAPGMMEDRPARPSYPCPRSWERRDRFWAYPPPMGYDDEYVPPPPPEASEMAPANPAVVLPPAGEGREGLPGKDAPGAGGDAAAAVQPPSDASEAPANPAVVLPPAGEGREGLPGKDAQGAGGDAAAVPPAADVSPGPAVEAGPVDLAPQGKSSKAQSGAPSQP